ncbi:glycosyltransferase [Candidatus Nitrosocosmicus sp. R]
MNRSKTVTIIAPILNKEQSIKKTIDSIPLGYLNKVYNVNKLVVHGNSFDKIVYVAKESRAKVIVKENRDYERAYKTGFLQASGETTITMDGNFIYPAEKISEYLFFAKKIILIS